MDIQRPESVLKKKKLRRMSDGAAVVSTAARIPAGGKS